jgi:hypothetical protein
MYHQERNIEVLKDEQKNIKEWTVREGITGASNQ